MVYKVVYKITEQGAYFGYGERKYQSDFRGAVRAVMEGHYVETIIKEMPEEKEAN